MADLFPRISKDISKFSKFLEKDYIYIDKTEKIHELLIDRRPHLFLSRPRRFGKTLLIDTLEEALTGRKELFSGLAIDRLRGEKDWPRCHVLRIGMNAFGNDPSTLDTSITNYLKTFADSRGITLRNNNSASCLTELLSIIHRDYDDIPIVTTHINFSENIKADKQEIAILIDEYDAPIINNLTDPIKLNIAKNTLHGFYNALKFCDIYTDRIFITGITKFAQLSVFSALNNLEDITFDTNYATICGFTEEEIKKYYKNELELVLSILQNKGKFGPTFNWELLIDRLVKWYDGYSWNGIDHVINPLSLQKFFLSQSFGNYWIRSGGTNFLNEMNIKDNIFQKVFQGKSTFKGSVDVQDAGNADSIAIMLQSGYLTVRSQKISSEVSILYLTVPNKEVGMAIMKNYVDLRITPIIEHATDVFKVKTSSKFIEAFLKRQSDEAGAFLHAILSCIPYSLHLPFEAFYNSLLLSIFRSADVDVEPEVDKAKGIIDLVIMSPDYGIMITEIKYARSDVEIDDKNKKKSTKITEKDRRQLNSSVREAFKQILDQEYLSPYRGSEIPVYAVAIAVCGRSHVKIKSYPAEELLNNPTIYLTDKTMGSGDDSLTKEISVKSSAPKKLKSRKPCP
jgi:hypothetical protein